VAAVGDTLHGTVVRVEEYGVYVDAAGCEVLVLVPELSWKPPPPQYRVGQHLHVKLIRKTPRGFSGSVRRLNRGENPYLALEEAPSGTTHVGRVKYVEDTVDVELPNRALGPVVGDGVEGLEIGDKVEVKPIEVDAEEGKVRFELVRRCT